MIHTGVQSAGCLLQALRNLSALCCCGTKAMLLSATRSAARRRCVRGKCTGAARREANASRLAHATPPWPPGSGCFTVWRPVPESSSWQGGGDRHGEEVVQPLRLARAVGGNERRGDDLAGPICNRQERRTLRRRDRSLPWGASSVQCSGGRPSLLRGALRGGRDPSTRARVHHLQGRRDASERAHSQPSCGGEEELDSARARCRRG